MAAESPQQQHTIQVDPSQAQRPTERDFNRIAQDLMGGNAETDEERQGMQEHSGLLQQANALESQIAAFQDQIEQLKTRKLKTQGAMEYIMQKLVGLRFGAEYTRRAAREDAAAAPNSKSNTPQIQGAESQPPPAPSGAEAGAQAATQQPMSN